MKKPKFNMDLASKAVREFCVRQGFLPPRNEQEERQKEEGPVPDPNKDLDCLKD